MIHFYFGDDYSLIWLSFEVLAIFVELELNRTKLDGCLNIVANRCRWESQLERFKIVPRFVLSKLAWFGFDLTRDFENSRRFCVESLQFTTVGSFFCYFFLVAANCERWFNGMVLKVFSRSR